MPMQVKVTTVLCFIAQDVAQDVLVKITNVLVFFELKLICDKEIVNKSVFKKREFLFSNISILIGDQLFKTGTVSNLWVDKICQ